MTILGLVNHRSRCDWFHGPGSFFKNPLVHNLFKRCHIFYDTPKFIIVLTRARHLPVSCSPSSQSLPLQRFVLEKKIWNRTLEPRHIEMRVLEMQGIHKRMVAVWKVNKKFISRLNTGTTYTVSSGNCPSFLCATSSSLLMLTAGPDCKMASQQEKAFCVLRFELSRSVITVQREFRARFGLWLMLFLLTSETAPFFCVYPV